MFPTRAKNLFIFILRIKNSAKLTTSISIKNDLNTSDMVETHLIVVTDKAIIVFSIVFCLLKFILVVTLCICVLGVGICFVLFWLETSGNEFL